MSLNKTTNKQSITPTTRSNVEVYIDGYLNEHLNDIASAFGQDDSDKILITSENPKNRITFIVKELPFSCGILEIGNIEIEGKLIYNNVLIVNKVNKIIREAIKEHQNVVVVNTIKNTPADKFFAKILCLKLDRTYRNGNTNNTINMRSDNIIGNIIK